MGSEGVFGLKRATGRGQTLQAIGTVAVTGQATVTLNILNFQVALIAPVNASNVYEFAKITSTTAPSLVINVTTSTAVSSNATTCHYTIFGNSE
jgi:hypothetical protein